MATTERAGPKALNDTIVAIATPSGEGGLGVVRLSGPESLPIAQKIFETPKGELSTFPTHTLHHGWIKDEADVIDGVIIAIYKNPRSYTGEDVIEFLCHGSPLVLKRLVHLCQKMGARLAKPGEFTERAFLNGKIDLAQAEAVSNLIHAKSEKARQAAAAQLKGHLSSRVQAIHKDLMELLAHMEANLDYVEEDIPILGSEELKKQLERAKGDVNTLLASGVRGRILREGIRVGILGKPNVGKSSLFNALLMEERAIVSPYPGTTRDTLEERVQWDGYALQLIDTAGIRDTTDEIEKEGTERSKKARDLSDLVLCVLDGSAPLDEGDKRLLADLKGKNCVIVLNKIDTGNAITMEDVKKIYGEAPMAKVSALKSHGLENLKKIIIEAIHADYPEVEGTVTVVNARHVEKLETAREKIESALGAISLGKPDESVAIDVRDALQSLSDILGTDAGEDVLNAIFSQFCVGK